MLLETHWPLMLQAFLSSLQHPEHRALCSLPHGKAKGGISMVLRVGPPTSSISISREWRNADDQPHPDLPNQSSECVFTGSWQILTSTTVWEPKFHLISQFLFSLECQLLEEEGFNPALSLPITLSRSTRIVGPYYKSRKFDQKTYFLFLLFCYFVYLKLHQTGFI